MNPPHDHRRPLLLPQHQPHIRANVLFSLKPLTEQAMDAVNHQANRHLLSSLDNGQLVLGIGHTQSNFGGGATLVNLGRDGDVVLQGSTISRIQCSFEINSETQIVMFVDRSSNQSTQVFGENSYPFADGLERKVFVQQGINPIIGMGGINRSDIQFEIIWHHYNDHAQSYIKRRGDICLELNPRFADTELEVHSIVRGRMNSLETPPWMNNSPKIRYHMGEVLGKGGFGEVSKAVDVDTGRVMAVKSIECDWKAKDSRILTLLRREIESLSQISHVSHFLSVNRAQITIHSLTL